MASFQKLNLEKWAQPLGDLSFQRACRREHKQWLVRSHKKTTGLSIPNAADLRTMILDFRGFDSGIISILMGAIPKPIGNLPESLSRRVLVGRIFVGAVRCSTGMLSPAQIVPARSSIRAWYSMKLKRVTSTVQVVFCVYVVMLFKFHYLMAFLVSCVCPRRCNLPGRLTIRGGEADNKSPLYEMR